MINLLLKLKTVIKQLRNVILRSFLITTICSIWIHGYLYGQNTSILESPISVSIKNTQAKKAIKKLTNSIGYNFSYDASLLKNTKVELVEESITPRKALHKIFGDSTLIIKEIDQNILIYKNTIRPSNQHISNKVQEQVIGRVLDAQTLLPIPYASVRTATNDYFTSTNQDGVFNISFNQKDSVQLIVSSISYIPVEKSIRPNLDEPITILLKPTVLTLREVIIRSVSPELILETSLKNISKNFPSRPSSAKGFFREVIYIEDKPAALSEACIELYKQSYKNIKKDRLKLVRGRKLKNKYISDTLTLKLKGSLQSCLDLDIVKNQPHFFSPNHLGYDYTYHDVLPYDGALVYKINFKSNGLNPNDLYNGSLYIDESTKTLRSVEFEIPSKNLQKAETILISKKTRKTKVKFVKANYLINYQLIDSLTYLNYVRLESNFKIGKKGSFRMTNYTIRAELAINEVDFESPEDISISESSVTKKVLFDLPMDYDHNYWSGYNFLPLDIYLFDALKTLDNQIDK